MRVLLSILLLSVVSGACAGEGRVENITYDQFVAAVEDGSIKSVHFYNLAGIEGTMLVNGNEVRFDTARAFPSSTDPLLLRLLKEKGVSHTQSDEQKFVRSAFNFGWWTLMQLGFVMTGGLVVIAFIQLRILRRLERQATQLAQPPSGS